MKIAVDAMGGDNAPLAPVQGALSALEEIGDLEIVLVGDVDRIKPLLRDKPRQTRLILHHAPDVIGMGEAPVQAVRRKPDSSMVQAIKLVKQQEAMAVISAGNTGALMTAGLFIIGRMPGIERPALSALLPVMKGWGVLLLDVGANLDPKPSQLVQYGVMGAYYCQEVYGIPNPRVGLLNVGEEPRKGTPLARETYERLRQSDLNFVGNIESRELLQGRADVVVSDGFSGNIALKLTEGLARDLMGEFKKVLLANFKTKIAAWMLKDGLMALKRRMDYEEYGGAPLLGLDQIVYKVHGASQQRAFHTAITLAYSYCHKHTQDRIRERVREEEANQ
ncbi:MAG: phosphate acyltransferase PlsX [Sulfobacillus thermosulfidooxidans]|uniref:Phosphate acyltransferase n=1 Tax=Sulfobacillus thermotolerans TaxID=338644 RepID=A0ABN5H3R6_9FIRM|nr:phosphate acyltransferase PlsX [Sulfobacillus sp. hq2]AUW94524.1 phosphate acyltransferase [Sulfobacillus thermotolerans]MCY0908057.1 phosphate acyltransferase PlsX [Sulfobacillus thermotolerans]POB09181.1 phosphate acyltransferase [Sulfobacillus sp. hq2]PSR36903.1 MAG: phosphate acyltransferase PlsX [Sulfobacillus thermosulfidooxidans]